MTPDQIDPARRALVVGAGPAGLAVAQCLRRLGVPFDLVDRRGEVGGAYQRIRPGLTLLSVARNASLPGLRFVPVTRYATAGDYRDYLVRYAGRYGLRPRAEELVRLERTGVRFAAWFERSGGPTVYGAAVVATGMFDHPYSANIPGLARQKSGVQSSLVVVHTSGWPGADPYCGRRILVVGGGTSGVEVSEDCAAAGVPVTLSARRPVRVIPTRLGGLDLHQAGYHLMRFAPRAVVERYCGGRLRAPAVDRGFRGAVRAGRIRLVGPVRRFDGPTAVFEGGGQEAFDVVVLATGYRFDFPFLTPGLFSRRTDPEPVSAPPGMFFVGRRCARTASSEFLKGIAADAPVVARRVADHLSRAGRAGHPPDTI